MFAAFISNAQDTSSKKTHLDSLTGIKKTNQLTSTDTSSLTYKNKMKMAPSASNAKQNVNEDRPALPTPAVDAAAKRRSQTSSIPPQY